MSQKYEKLKALLKELFQLDQPDLDFGLYRIMHAKAAEVTQFLDRDLLPQVKEEFAKHKTADKAALEQQLAKAVEQAQALGADPESLPKVKELRAQLSDDAVDLAALESEVYDHLYSFFRRYYSEGDFLSKRVYKPGVYAIPYEGEEVKLHWANADQYYIKTSEYLRDYAFRLHPDDEENPMRVHFRLVDATEGEHGNVKAAEGKDRTFILASEDFASIEQGAQGAELSFRFEYRPPALTDWPDDVRDGKKKPPTQKEMTELAESRIMAAGSNLADWLAELRKPHEKADGESAAYSRLRAHLNRYVARNTFDYFIHKDLGGFLRRELDFYIKNEVMHLDDVDGQQAPRVEQYLSKVRVIRRVANKLIVFLAHLEDFQKKLWLKKKFVVATNYCIALASIPEEFYAEIADNDAQRQEWVELFAINEIDRDLTSHGYTEPLAVEFLKIHQRLMIDTRFFSDQFRDRVLASLTDLDMHPGGLAIQGDNFQSMHLISAKHRGTVKCAYIDPPYNTGDDGFSYKDAYQHSTWISMLVDRVSLLRTLLREDGAFFASIDDREAMPLRWVLDCIFGRSEFVSDIAVINNWKGRQDRDHIATAHEHMLFYGMPSFESFGFALSEAQLADYDQEDESGERYQLRDLRKRGGADTRTARPNLYFPLYWDVESRRAFLSRQSPTDVEVFPVKSDGTDGCWRWKSDTVRENLEILEARQVAESGRWNVSYRVYLEANGETRTAKPKSVWAGTKYSSDRAIKTLRAMLPNTHFRSPKAVGFIQDLVHHSTCDDEIIIDAFAGSGSSAHAVISANRADRGERRFVVIEQSDDFDLVIVPRLKKVALASSWSGGKPSDLHNASDAAWFPRIIKCIRLESYEDALNNLQLRRPNAQQTLLESTRNAETSRLKEQYMLGYMLNVETEGSQSLLNVQAFTDPTSYRLKVKGPGSDETREVNVDLLETFNWLIGLSVQHIAAPRRFSANCHRDSEGRLQLKGRLKQEDEGAYWFRTVTGTTPEGRKTLVIWRKRPGGEAPEGVEQDNLVLDEWFTRQGYSSKDSEFDLIYVNGTNNLENLRAPDDTWKVRLIEDDFHRLMFATEGL